LRTDEDTFNNICETVLQEAFKLKEGGKSFGLSGCIQCIMIPKSGRVKKSSLEILSKMLQTFTLSYPESIKKGPAFYVLFTDFSRFEE